MTDSGQGPEPAERGDGQGAGRKPPAGRGRPGKRLISSLREHPTRSQVLGLLKGREGLSVAQLCRELGGQ